VHRGLFSFVLCLLVAAGAAAVEVQPFTELWNNFAYYDTNLERQGFASILGRCEGKVGIYLPDSPFQLYGAYYGTTSQTSDYFDNSLFAGAGLRVKPIEGLIKRKDRTWLNEWIPDIKIFVEGLGANYLKGAASAESAGLSKTDTRLGLDLWHEWNLDKPDEGSPWGELWTNLSYRSSNFGWEPFNNYIFYFQPKVGRHLGRGIEPYLRADIVYSGKSGASYSFLNVADYGVGIRFEPWRNREGASELLGKFKMFFEVLGVSYLKDKPAAANQVVDRDLRFGIDFSFGRVY